MKTKIFFFIFFFIFLINKVFAQTISFIPIPTGNKNLNKCFLLEQKIWLGEINAYPTYYSGDFGLTWEEDYETKFGDISGIRNSSEQNIVYQISNNGFYYWNDGFARWTFVPTPYSLQNGARIRVLNDSCIYLLSSSTFPVLYRYTGNSFVELYRDTIPMGYRPFLYADSNRIVFSRVSSRVLLSYDIEQDVLIELVSFPNIIEIRQVQSLNGVDFFILSIDGNLYRYNIETQILTDLIICPEEEKYFFGRTLEVVNNNLIFIAGYKGIKKVWISSGGGVSSEVIYQPSHNNYYVNSSSRFGSKIIFAGFIGENINGSISSAIISIDCSVGVVEPVIPEVNIYPNPTKDQIKIDGLIEPSNVQIFDIYGKLVLAQEYQDNEEINISNLNVGVYILQVRNSKGVFSQKLIKQ